MNQKSPILNLKRRDGLLSFSILCSIVTWIALPVVAHEVIVTPTKSGRYHVDVGGKAHLQHQTVDFGEGLVGTSTTRTVLVSNTSRRSVTVVPAALPQMTVTPAQLVLAAEGEAGSSGSFVLTYTRTSVEGPFSGTVELAVSHEGVGMAKAEAIDFVGVSVTPPRLELSVPELGLYDIHSVDLGIMSNRHYDPYEHPSFEVVVTNTGGTTARNLKLKFLELLFTYPSAWGYGDCAANATMNLCVVGEGGLDVNALGDLAPGASLTTTWTLAPYASGDYDPVLRFDTADPAVSAEIEVVVEVIPFTLPPGKDFIKSYGEAANHMGTVADPLGEDPLVELRPKSFDARTVFSVGEFDTVDLRAGNLTLVIPIGGEIKARGALSYSLNAVYNSDLWYRKTLDENEGEPGDPGGFARPLSGEWPDPTFNMVGGWALHLGRLLPPNDFEGVDVDSICSSADPLSFERRVDTGQRFSYVDPNGTSHELWAALHGDEPYSADPDWDAPSEQHFSYTRDGSYLRMEKVSPSVRYIEEPGGIRRRFERLGGAHTGTLPDEWLLTAIEDRHGNKVTVTYDGNKWILRDNAGGTGWRTVEIGFLDWPGRKKNSVGPNGLPDPTADQPMIVSSVVLPGFDDQASRTYQFEYSYKSIERPARSSFHHHAAAVGASCVASILTIPQLDRIDLPDDTSWGFQYEYRALPASTTDDELRMTRVDLPTGATVHYEYADQIWDTGNTCTAGPPPKGHSGVKLRRVTDGAATLETVRYLRELVRTDDIPFGYCAIERAPAVTSRPWAQQRVGVWRDLGPQPEPSSWGFTLPKSTLKIHHFNIWPYSDRCPEGHPDTCVPRDAGWALASGRTHVERNLMLDLSMTQGDLARSTETFTCANIVGSVGWLGLSSETETDPHPSAGDNIQQAINACPTKVEETWARYEVSLAGNCSNSSSPNCLRDSRLIKEKTVFKDPGVAGNPGIPDYFRQTDKSDFDGLGHYRRQKTSTSNWPLGGLSTPLERTIYQNFNPGVGTLQLDADHRVTNPINVPGTWLLETFDHQWTKEGSIYRGGEACFDPGTGTQRATRAWRCQSGGYTCGTVESAGLSSVRNSSDVVVSRVVNGFGEVVKGRYFGGDGAGVSTANGWCDASFGWPDASADYTVDSTYAFGQVATKKVHGESTYEIHRNVDQDTGWTKSDILDSGEVISYDYDGMGRMTSALSDQAASYLFAYLPDGPRRKLQARTRGLGGLAGPLIRTYMAHYDGLGRLSSEDLPKADGGTVTRTVQYDQGGRVSKVSSLDTTGNYTKISYDHRSRPIVQSNPDGSRMELLHYGERWSRQFTCLGTVGSSSASGVCRNSSGEVVETGIFKDFAGRVRRVKTAASGGDPGIRTDFTYDPADRRLSAVRKSASGGTSQRRDWTLDGLGNLRRESIPERVDTVFSSFDSRGNARQVSTGSRGTSLVFDDLSRLRSLSVGSLQVKEFDYHTTGFGNGKLKEGIRRTHRDSDYTPTESAGRFDVVSTFDYDSAGRQSSRITTADYFDDMSGTVTRLGNFQQTWQYDPLGNVKRSGYPTCVTGSHCTDDVLDVDYQFSQGHYLTGVDVAGSSSLGAALTYHPSGLVYQVVHEGGGGTDVYGVTGGMSRIASMTLASGTGSALSLGALTYDSAGNVRSIGTESFSYDRHGRLTDAMVRSPSGLASYGYSYDVFDNRLTAAATDATTNQITGAGFAYDPFGNLTAAPGGHVAVYDEVDKLVSLDYPQGSLEDVRQISIYDHADLRVVRWNKNKLVDPDVPGVEEPPVWTLRDGLQVIRELEGTGPGMRTSADFIYAGSRLLSSRRYAGTNYGSGTERHYHADQVGTSRLVTGSSGHEVFTEPFGVPVGAVTSGENTVGFQGHESDGALTYMRGRHYYPGLGRFIQVDPGRDTSAWSLYSFATNSPLVVVDPTGNRALSESTQQWVGLGVAAVGVVAIGAASPVIVTAGIAVTVGGLALAAEPFVSDALAGSEGLPRNRDVVAENFAVFQSAISNRESEVSSLQHQIRGLERDKKVVDDGPQARTARMQQAKATFRGEKFETDPKAIQEGLASANARLQEVRAEIKALEAKRQELLDSAAAALLTPN